MSGSFLLDTNIVIAIFSGDPAILAHLADADEVLIPSVVLGELYYGAEKSGRPQDNRERIDEFAAENTIVSCTAITARHYGLIKNNLRAKGRPLPENDIWIAALAQEHGLTLVTRDGHFEAIDGLPVEAWE